jgi:hypothetical protein
MSSDFNPIGRRVRSLLDRIEGICTDIATHDSSRNPKLHLYYVLDGRTNRECVVPGYHLDVIGEDGEDDDE